MLPHEWHEDRKGITVCKYCKTVKTYSNDKHGCPVIAHMLFDKQSDEEVRWNKQARRRIRRYYP